MNAEVVAAPAEPVSASVESAATQTGVLVLDGLTVSFDGFRALNELSLAIDPGELRCVIGPNGAGKTTMMDVITGKTRPDAGIAFFANQHDLLEMTEPQIAHLGIGRPDAGPDSAGRCGRFACWQSVARTKAMAGNRHVADAGAGVVAAR